MNCLTSKQCHWGPVLILITSRPGHNRTVTSRHWDSDTDKVDGGSYLARFTVTLGSVIRGGCDKDA